ncbi:MAG: OmpA family protein, partial [Bacteroides sp.]|nr:OmpA family protein [Bacteroides sp.]MCM1414266.1 OmpA family protein [Bacteroides sp.]
MKKLFVIAMAACSILSASAQNYYKAARFDQNWSLGIDGGVFTPLASHYEFFGDMRGGFALHIDKQLSPVFKLGAEATFAINSSTWIENNPALLAAGYDLSGNSSAAIDRFYVGAYGEVDLFNLFGGFQCYRRKFDISLQAGAGWGYLDPIHQNYFATKAGVNFNFNFSKNFTLSLKPAVTFNMTGTDYDHLDVAQTSAAYTRKMATFSFMAGFTYHFGPGFRCADTGDQGEIDALNAQINDLRSQIDACLAATAANQAAAAATAAELEACKNRKPTVVEKVNDNLQSVRYVFYKIGSSKITVDQQPNVEMVASYLKNHKDSKVIVKGYASQDGNLEFNKKLAAARAESV